MTDAPYGGLPPANDPLREPAPDSGIYADAPQGASTTDTAKESAQRVAGTAAEQGKNVLAEGKAQARDLTKQVGEQAHEQTNVQRDKAATGLRSLSEELHGMANGQGGRDGVASDLARQAAVKAQDLAGWLESREPGDLLEEVRQLARRKPGTFLLGALAAGVVAGRLTRGAVDASRGTDGYGTDPLRGYPGTASAGRAAGTTRPDPSDTPIATGVALDTDTTEPDTTALPGDPVSAGQSTGFYR
jgi:hypothetical protein